MNLGLGVGKRELYFELGGGKHFTGFNEHLTEVKNLPPLEVHFAVNPGEGEVVNHVAKGRDTLVLAAIDHHG